MNKIPFTEIEARMMRFRDKMNKENPDWEAAVFFSKVNQFYFTGTMQDGMLFIPRDEEAVYWVRKSFDRAMDETEFLCVRPMESFRDAAAFYRKLPETVYTETEVVPLALYKRFQKHFAFKEVKPLDLQISDVRAVKSQYELSLIKKSGNIHKKVLEELVPDILKEGMSELELAAKLFSVMLREGHHGVSRFKMFDTDMGIGQIGFGESSNYPTFFNGPGGSYGYSAAVPILGSNERKLKKGDLVFIDVGCGVDGYHTDKTMTYMFGEPLSDEVISIHKKCVDIQMETAEMLKPGAIPSQIYANVMGKLDAEFIKNFMGYGKNTVKFLGHGVGLHIDELPVIAKGFNNPIEEGMVFALEPKRGIEGVGMVGLENTFMVSPHGGICLTGDNPGLIAVY